MSVRTPAPGSFNCRTFAIPLTKNTIAGQNNHKVPVAAKIITNNLFAKIIFRGNRFGVMYYKNTLHSAKKQARERPQKHYKNNCFREVFCNNFGQDGRCLAVPCCQSHAHEKCGRAQHAWSMAAAYAKRVKLEGGKELLKAPAKGPCGHCCAPGRGGGGPALGELVHFICNKYKNKHVGDMPLAATLQRKCCGGTRCANKKSKAQELLQKGSPQGFFCLIFSARTLPLRTPRPTTESRDSPTQNFHRKIPPKIPPRKCPENTEKIPKTAFLVFSGAFLPLFSGYFLVFFWGVQNFGPGGLFPAFFVEIPGRAISGRSQWYLPIGVSQSAQGRCCQGFMSLINGAFDVVQLIQILVDS